MHKVRASGEFELAIYIYEERMEGLPDPFKRAMEPDFPYRLDNRADVIDHLTHNALTNGVQDISELDGWADYPSGAVIFRAQVFDSEELT